MSGGCEPCQRKGNGVKEDAEAELEDDITANIIAYPNPSHGIFTIRLKKDIEIVNNFLISIYDVKGRFVKSMTIEKRTFDVDLRAHPAGLYLLKTNNLNIRLAKE